MTKTRRPRLRRSGWRLALVIGAALLAIVLAVQLYFISAPGPSPTDAQPVGPEQEEATKPAPKMSAAAEKSKPHRPRPGTPAAARHLLEPGTTQAGILRGKVIERSGDRVAGATVTLDRVDRYGSPFARIGLATSDALGRFEFLDLAFDSYLSYVVKAVAEDAVAVQSFGVDAGRPVHNALLLLQPCGLIAGFVRNKDEARIAGAVLSPHSRQGGGDYWAYRASQTISDEEGNFVIENLPEGQWKLYVVAEGYAPEITDPIEVGEQNAEIVLVSGASISGQVIDAVTGGGVPGVRIYIPSPFRNMPETMTDAEGRFRLEGIPEATYAGIFAAGKGLIMLTKQRSIKIVDGCEISDLQILVTRGGVIAGRVYDADTNQGVAAAEVVARSDDERRIGSSSKTDSSGCYRTDALLEGVYSIWATPPEPYRRPKEETRKYVSVKLGEQIGGIDLPVRKALLITGVVIDERGNAVGDASVQATPKDPPYYGVPFSEKTHSGHDGSFELGWTRPVDEFYIQARKEGLRSETLGPFAVGAGAAKGIVLTIRSGGISGTVVNESWEPLAKADVLAESSSEPPSLPSYLRGRHSSTTDSGGNFEIVSLPPDTYGVRLSPPGSPYWGDVVKELAVGAGETVSGVLLVLDTSEWGSLEGIVNVTGRRATDASVFVSYPNQESPKSKGGGTDQDGSYKITGLLPGEAEVTVNAPLQTSEGKRWLSDSKRAVIEGGQATVVNFDLSSGHATLEGKILLNGKPPRSALIKLLGPENYDAVVSHDAKGFYRFENLPAGMFTMSVIAYFPAVRTRTVKVETVSGQVTRQDMIFSDGRIVGEVGGVGSDESVSVSVLSGTLNVDSLIQQGDEGMRQLAERIKSSPELDSENRFRIERLPPGIYTVFALATPLRPHAQTDESSAPRFTSAAVEVHEGKDTPVQLFLQ